MIIRLFIVGVIFLIIGFITEFWVDKNKHKYSFGFRGQIVGLIVVLEWFCFIAGLYFADIIKR